MLEKENVVLPTGHIKESLKHARSLIIFTPRQHNHIRSRRPRRHSLGVRLVALGRAVEQAHALLEHAVEVALAVGRQDAEDVGSGVLGEVGLLEHALRRVDVRQVERGARVTRVEDGGQPHACGQRAHHDAVHLVVCDVPDLPEVDGVDDFVVAVVFVAVEVFGLSAVALGVGLA